MKKYTVTGEWEGSRLDRFVRSILPHLSFPAAQGLVRRKDVLLNGKKADGAARLSAGDLVEVRFPAANEDEAQGRGRAARGGSFGEEPRGAQAGQALRADELSRRFGLIGQGIPIIFEDRDILAIDKPAGLPVQPGNKKELGSLLDLLEIYRMSGKARGGRRRAGSSPEGGSSRDPGSRGPADDTAADPADSFPYTPAHRLDSPTSGLLLVAKTRKAARGLSEAFRAGKVEKKYLAVVEGIPRDKSGRIDTKLETIKGVDSTSAPSPGGREAVTLYKVLKSTRRGRSMLEIKISTGRTHQIRAHMASIGHPVAGDVKYGPGAASARDGGKARLPQAKGSGDPRPLQANDRPSRGRLMLHSWKIAFTHPVTGERVRFTSSPPDDFVL
jgi:23S rRNA-/tRNA-specific pseudouridylate synthase